MPIIRLCNTCGKTKKLEEFEKGRKGKPTCRCKQCHAEYQRLKRNEEGKKRLIQRRLADRIERLLLFAELNNIKIKIEVQND